MTDEIAALWAKGDIRVAYDPDPDAKHEAPPDKPARYARPRRSSSRRAPETSLRADSRAPGSSRPAKTKKLFLPLDLTHPNASFRLYFLSPLVPKSHLVPKSLLSRYRDDRVTLVEPSKAPKLGKGGSPESRVAILHSLAHIESWAIDLSWDVIARFGAKRQMPTAFFDDFVAVAKDESRHFSKLAARLEALGSHYGALSAHDGLWNSAAETAGSLEARLVIEHCVHEARGLDVLPATIGKFRNGGDDASADLLQHVIYPEEVTHCAAGVRWFTFLCARRDASVGDTHVDAVNLWEGQAPLDTERAVENEKYAADAAAAAARAKQERLFSEPNVAEASAEKNGNLSSAREALAREVFASKRRRNPEPPLAEDASVIERFHRIVWRHFRGVLKPPFNDAARARAGFGKEWYEPLCFRPEWETRDVELDAAKFFAEAEAKEAEKRAEEARKQKQADDIEDTNRRIFLL